MGLVWAISASFIYIGLLIRAFPHLQTLNLTYCLKSSLLHASCFLFNCMTNLNQICLTPWNSFNGKMDDILPLVLFQGIIRNIERLKERTLLPGEGHKLDSRNWTSDHSSYHDTNRSSAGLRDPTSLLGSMSPSSQT